MIKPPETKAGPVGLIFGKHRTQGACCPRFRFRRFNQLDHVFWNRIVKAIFLVF